MSNDKLIPIPPPDESEGGLYARYQALERELESGGKLPPDVRDWGMLLWKMQRIYTREDVGQQCAKILRRLRWQRWIFCLLGFLVGILIGRT